MNADDTISPSIKGYTLREKIGSGGFGAVYHAYQPIVDREVAIKVILPEHANRPDFIRRFEAEAQLVAKLEHPYIVPLYDYWRDTDGAYLVMRWLRGGSLRAALKAGQRWDMPVLIQWLDQIGGALNIAHRRGIIHRDIKPDNILLDEDQNAYLADFGIATTREGAQIDSDGGLMTGSPAYLSPEQIRGDPISMQADLYSLGITFYELITGTNPYEIGKTSLSEVFLMHLQTPLPPLRSLRPDLPAELSEVFHHVTAKAPAERYGDVVAFVQGFHKAMGLAKRDTSTTTTSLHRTSSQILINITLDDKTLVLIEPENPYKGLRAFQEADAADFFGRRAQIIQLSKRLQEQRTLDRFLALVGPSGSGKSSLVRAGLIPALRQGVLPGSQGWFYIDMMPGAQPFDELADALLRVASRPVPNLRERLAASKNGLRDVVDQLLPDDPQLPPKDQSQLVLFIDQFEELFTMVEDESIRTRFMEAILAAATSLTGRLWVILTLRADFYDRPLQYLNFGALLRRFTEVVLPLEIAELEQAIYGPAERVGLRIEPELTTAIVDEISAQPGVLPLLQYALTELYEHRQGVLLTLKAYRDVGGVSGALAKRAETLYQDLDPLAQEATRQVFLRLVTLGDGAEDTRRRAAQSELQAVNDPHLGKAIQHIIGEFGKYRLLTFDHDPKTRLPTVEIAHEALIRTWTRVKEWLNANREIIRLQRRLAQSATEWQSAGRDASFLASGSRLAQYEGLIGNDQIALNNEEIAFIRASIAERDRTIRAEAERKDHELALARSAADAQHKAAQRLQYLAIFMAAAVIILIILSLFTLSEQQRATNNERLAVANASTAIIAQGQAQNSAATSVANAGTASANFRQAEGLRLASEASRFLQSGSSSELTALLGVRALKTSYSPQGDAILQQVTLSDFAEQLFQGHADRLWAVAYSPDGKTVLTGSVDTTIRLWDVRTGAELQRFSGHSGAITAVAYAPDGKTILSSSVDTTARLWDISTGKEIRQFVGHAAAVSGIAFSPDGKQVLTGSEDSTARLWDTATGKSLVTFVGHVGQIQSVAFSPDGKFVLTGALSLTSDEDFTARLWDVKTGKEIRRFTGQTGAVTAVAFSPDGKTIVTGSSDGAARIFNVDTGEIMRSVAHPKLLSVAFSPDGRLLATASQEGSARLWDIGSGLLVKQFIGQTGPVNSLAFSPDGKWLVTGSQDKLARLWNTQIDANPYLFIGHLSGVTAAVFSPDGKTILTGSFDGSARLWDAQTHELLQAYLGHDAGVTSVGFSPDGRRIIIAGNDRTPTIWDIAANQEILQLTGHTEGVRSAAFSPDGTLILTSSLDKTARLWDATTGKPLQLLEHPDVVLNAAFSPDGKWVITGCRDKLARIWDARTGKLVRTLSGHQSSVVGVAISPDGRYALTGSGRFQETLGGAGTVDNSVRLWDLQTGQEIRRYVGHLQVVVSVAFSADGSRILSASWDNTVRLWDTQIGVEIRRLVGHRSPVWSALFSPDGTRILTASEDRSARLWEVDVKTLIDAVCTRLKRDFTDDERAQLNLTDRNPTCGKDN